MYHWFGWSEFNQSDTHTCIWKYQCKFPITAETHTVDLCFYILEVKIQNCIKPVGGVNQVYVPPERLRATFLFSLCRLKDVTGVPLPVGSFLFQSHRTWVFLISQGCLFCSFMEKHHPGCLGPAERSRWSQNMVIFLLVFIFFLYLFIY